MDIISFNPTGHGDFQQNWDSKRDHVTISHVVGMKWDYQWMCPHFAEGVLLGSRGKILNYCRGGLADGQFPETLGISPIKMKQKGKIILKIYRMKVVGLTSQNVLPTECIFIVYYDVYIYIYIQSYIYILSKCFYIYSCACPILCLRVLYRIGYINSVYIYI